MVLDFLRGGGKSKAKSGQNEEESKESSAPSSAAAPSYPYPTLYEEADEMLQNSLLIYAVTDLRTLAKQKKLKNHPERILELPVTLSTALSMIEDNFELIQRELGDDQHELALSALKSIQERYDRHHASLLSSSQRQRSGSGSGWMNPFRQENDSNDNLKPAYLTKYGDDKPDKELVYAVGVDPVRRRVTVAFRGSVTPSDFVCDACISFSKRENPLKKHVEGQESHIGIHHGFDEYLLKRRRKVLVGNSKYDEILEHVEELFQDKERRETYKLYVTGHSLGGALATLFALEVAASLSTAKDSSSNIPTPVTCVSVASPRVGDLSFQKVHRYLEQNGALRHLRIANAGDPVTIMPKWSSKKLFAMLSPISYVAFKIQDQDFAERETYRHTGIKLRLNREKQGSGNRPVYELSYSGVTSAKEELEKDDEDDDAVAEAKTKKSWKVFSSVKDVPNVSLHFGVAYASNLKTVKEELSTMTLNELYATLAKADSS